MDEGSDPSPLRGLRDLLSGFSTSCQRVCESAVSDDKMRRDRLEADCLYEATQLREVFPKLLADLLKDLVQAPEGKANHRPASDLIRLLLTVPDRASNALCAARRPFASSPNSGIVHIETAGSASRRTTPLEGLPPAVMSDEAWATAVVVVVIPATAGKHTDPAIAVASELLHALRLRGMVHVTANALLACPDTTWVAKVLLRTSGPTAELVLRAVLLRGAKGRREECRGVVSGICALQPSEHSWVVDPAARLLTQGDLPREAGHLLVTSLFGLERRDTSFTPTPAARAVRARVFARFADTAALAQNPTGLCYAAVWMMERIDHNTLQNEGLLQFALSGISERLGSPIKSHRRMACIAARCLSFILDPGNPLDFDDFPRMYEQWCAIDDGVAAPPAPPVPCPEAEAKAARKRAVTLQQDRPDDPVFSDDEEEKDGPDDGSEGFWGDDLESIEAVNEEDSAGEQRTQLYLREAVKILNGKKEDYQEMEGLLRALPSRIDAERDEEVAAVSHELLSRLLYLSNSFALEGFDELRTEAIVRLLCRSPKNTVPFVVSQVWSEHMGTVQRVEALQLLGLAAARLRHAPAETEEEEESPQAALMLHTKGVAAVRARRPYPPIEEKGEDEAKAVIDKRVAERTRRWGNAALHRQEARVIRYQNRLEQHAALFVYNLIGTTESKHYKPASADDPTVIAELLRMLWGICDALRGGSMDSERVVAAVLEYAWSIASHQSEFVLAHVLAVAGAAINALTFPDLDSLQQWMGLAEKIRKGDVAAGDASCRAMAGNLAHAIMAKLDEITGPQDHQPRKPMIVELT
eukprot:Sspe_Gene.37385::Locus_18049_Transcript_2_2_Confidence_0.750_Length_4017::g.37385::m.37385/K11137/TELO2, TEL2; telomere length regulation protein